MWKVFHRNCLTANVHCKHVLLLLAIHFILKGRRTLFDINFINLSLSARKRLNGGEIGEDEKGKRSEKFRSELIDFSICTLWKKISCFVFRQIFILMTFVVISFDIGTTQNFERTLIERRERGREMPNLFSRIYYLEWIIMTAISSKLVETSGKKVFISRHIVLTTLQFNKFEFSCSRLAQRKKSFCVFVAGVCATATAQCSLAWPTLLAPRYHDTSKWKSKIQWLFMLAARKNSQQWKREVQGEQFNVTKARRRGWWTISSKNHYGWESEKAEQRAAAQVGAKHATFTHFELKSGALDEPPRFCWEKQL